MKLLYFMLHSVLCGNRRNLFRLNQGNYIVLSLPMQKSSWWWARRAGGILPSRRGLETVVEWPQLRARLAGRWLCPSYEMSIGPILKEPKDLPLSADLNHVEPLKGSLKIASLQFFETRSEYEQTFISGLW